MHQAHQTAPARTAHDHEGRGDQQRAPAQRVSPLPPGVTRQPGTAAAPGPRPAAALSEAAAAQAAATAEPWQMAILVPEPVPPSIKAARDFTTGTLLDWGLPGLIQDATLVVSELVTNALRHGARDGHGRTEPDRPELILWARDGYLVCVVIDASASPPVRVPAASPVRTAGACRSFRRWPAGGAGPCWGSTVRRSGRSWAVRRPAPGAPRPRLSWRRRNPDDRLAAAQVMQVRAVGRAVRRSSPIGSPHRSQIP